MCPQGVAEQVCSMVARFMLQTKFCCGGGLHLQRVQFGNVILSSLRRAGGPEVQKIHHQGPTTAAFQEIRTRTTIYHVTFLDYQNLFHGSPKL